MLLAIFSVGVVVPLDVVVLVGPLISLVFLFLLLLCCSFPLFCVIVSLFACFVVLRHILITLHIRLVRIRHSQ